MKKFLSVNTFLRLDVMRKNANAEEVNKLSLKIKECDEKIKLNLTLRMTLLN